MSISQVVNKIKPSATLSITSKVKQLKSEGVNVIGLSAGEPDFDTPEDIKLAAIESLKSGFTKYTHTSGIIELKEAICSMCCSWRCSSAAIAACSSGSNSSIVAASANIAAVLRGVKKEGLYSRRKIGNSPKSRLEAAIEFGISQGASVKDFTTRVQARARLSRL